jgi:hypothetical protein
MERIMDDADAYHRSKLQQTQPDVGVSEAQQRLAELRKRLCQNHKAPKKRR